MEQYRTATDLDCRNRLYQGGYPCDPPCQACGGAPVATLTRIPIQRDPVGTAQGHIREAIRHLVRLSITINAYAGDDDFGQPNRATAAMDELDQAMECLAVAR